MGNIDFRCDTEECMHWSEGACVKRTSITIQEHCCCDFEEKLPQYRYSLIAGVPSLLSEVFVTVSGGAYYKARLLGYGDYGGRSRKTYCVEVFKEGGSRFVDFFCDIYSKKWRINEMTVADEKMLIKTKLGTLVAYASDDDDHPGIYIDLRRPGFGEDAPLLLVECEQDGDRPTLKTKLWKDVSSEGYWDEVEHTGIRDFFLLTGGGEEDAEYPVDGDL